MAKESKENIESLLITQPTEADFKLFQYYKKHPDIACIDLLKQDLAPFQRIIVNGVQSHSYVISVLSRGSGKTRMIAMNAAIACMFNPRYRVAFLGPGFRQCPSLDTTYLPTSKGFVKGRELVSGEIVKSLKDDNKILNFNINEKSDGIEVWTKKGFYIEGKKEHKILVLNKETFETEYKNLTDLSMDDTIVLKNNTQVWNQDETSYLKKVRSFRYDNTKSQRYGYDLNFNNFNERTAYLLGLITGDGSMDEGHRRIDFTTIDSELETSYKEAINDIAPGANIKERKEKNSFSLSLKGLFEYFKFLGMKPGCLAKGKDIPFYIRTAPKKYISSFLSGLYDTDGTVIEKNRMSAEVKLTTSSFNLAHQVHSLLLNYGIISSLYKIKGRGKITICGRATFGNDYYDVSIKDKKSLKTFYDEIGFKLTRKQNILKHYVSGSFSNKDNTNFIPNIGNELKIKVKEGGFKLAEVGENCFKNNITLRRAAKLCKNLFNKGMTNSVLINNVIEYEKLNLLFLPIKEINKKEVETFDIEVENEECYIGNGFVNHNSKLAFNELMTIIEESPYLEASIKTVSRQTDVWTCTFHNGAVILALPLAADSATSIRGTRIHMALIDEYPHVPKDVMDLVINPMLATQRNPMKNVRRIEEEKKLIASGKMLTQNKSERNKICGFSSAYFQFNHMYQTICQYKSLGIEQKAKTGKSDYAVYTFNYKDAPEGFFDIEMIQHAKDTSSDIAFRMEYMSEFPSDSEGFFKRSLIDSIMSRPPNEFKIEMQGEKGFKYILGVDPARNLDNFSISILKIDGGIMKLVRVVTFNNTSFPEIAQFIRVLAHAYDIEIIGIDAGGGGLAIKDLLADPMTANGEEEIFLDMDDDGNVGKKGRMLLRMVNFAPNWISEANHNLRSSMEHRKLFFAAIRESSTFIKPVADALDLEDQGIVDYLALIDELQSIVVTASKNGVLHFDTQNQRMKKDRYSSLLIGHKICYDYLVQGYQPRQLSDGAWLGANGELNLGKDDNEFENKWNVTRIIDDISQAKNKIRNIGAGSLTD